MLRKAFDEMLKDPAFLDDAKKAGIDISPVGGDENSEDRRRFHEHARGHRHQGEARDGAQNITERSKMKKLHLSIATEDYDHFRDFRTGEVQAEGIEHTWLMPELHEIFARFTVQPRMGRERTVVCEILRRR